MTKRKIISEPVDIDHDGVRIVGGINAVVTANVGKSHTNASVSSRQRIVQRDGRTEITTTHHTSEEDNDEQHP